MKDLKNLFLLAALGFSLFVIEMKREKYYKKAKKKADEIHAKTIEAAKDNKAVFDIETMVRISLLICEIEKSCELSLYEISKTCRIKYKKPDPHIFYGLVAEELRALAT